MFEPPRRGGSNKYPHLGYVLSKSLKKIGIMHGQVRNVIYVYFQP